MIVKIVLCVTFVLTLEISIVIGLKASNGVTDESQKIIYPEDDMQGDIGYPSNIPPELIQRFNNQNYQTKSNYGKELSYGNLYDQSHGNTYSKSSYGVKTVPSGSGSYGSGGIQFTDKNGKRCPPRPKQPMNASLRCSTQINGCTATCMSQFEFPNGETRLFINCVDGEWTIEGSKWEEMPSCEPICMPPCQNNGICIKPGQCSCPENYIGLYCEKENRLCLTPPPLPKNSRRTCSSTSCTISCADGYRFPDGSTITNMFCNNGQWIPSRPEMAMVPDCQPICSPPCQNGGHCLSYNVCQCPQDYRGPQCQYSVDVCSPKNLNFNGAYNCSGNNDLIRCYLSCPHGVQFDKAVTIGNQYTCEYSNGIFKPQPIPQCQFSADMEIIHGAGSSKTFYKTYNNTSSGHRSVSKIKKIRYDDDGDDDDESYEKIITKTKIKIIKKRRKSKGGTYFEDDGDANDDEDSMQMLGMYSVYLSNDINVKYRTPKPAICMTWNGNKIKTFDGLLYTVNLHCSHTLLQDYVDGSFSVILRSCPYNPDSICYDAIELFLQNIQYTFENENGKFSLSTPKKQLPIPAQLAGMRVTLSGHNVRIVLEAVGATILWDGQKLLTIEATGGLFNRTAGLCGTMDQNFQNDFMSKDGSIHKVASTFIDSWAAPNLDRDKHKCAMIQNDGQELLCKPDVEDMATVVCNKLLNNPKLANCMKDLNKEHIVQTCISDYCFCPDAKNPSQCICDGVSVFARDCRFRGIDLDNSWRDFDICPITCSAGRIYKACGPTTEPSCGSAIEPNAIEQCVEGCYCPDGQLQHEGVCIPKESCPCTLRGKIFQPGQEIRKDCNTCKCDKGMWKCSDVTCGARCGSIGDPHYQTFDGKRYDFMGKCSYYLMKTDNFSVEAENVACPGSISESMNFGVTGVDMPSCTKSVTINLQNGDKIKSVKLKQGRQVLVDGLEIEKLPIKVLKGVLKVRQASSTMILVTFSDGLKIWWDGMTRVFLDAPAAYRQRTKGLCGTFNSNMQDDFLTPEGDIESSVTSFADKWRTKETCQYVSDLQEVPHPCQLNMENKQRALKYCGELKSKIFDECQWFVDPAPYYEDCLYDMCACNGDPSSCMCPIFASYASECARNGIVVNWRYAVSECAVKCPLGQVFEECGDDCYRTCEDLQSDEPCKTSCVEGCRCPHGQLLDESNECVPVGLCHCVYKGLTFKSGYKEVRPGRKYLELCKCNGAKWQCQEAVGDDKDKYPPADDLRTRCLISNNEIFTTCEPVEPLTCKNMHNYLPTSAAECRPGCVCKKDYVYDATEQKCVLPKDCSCHHGHKSYNVGDRIQSDCNNCICKSGNWNCTDRPCASTCTAWGDSHFETYDGKDFDFQGACSYVLSKGSMGSGEAFTVSIQNVLCGSMGVTCSKSITISIAGEHPDTVTLSSDMTIPGVKDTINKKSELQPFKKMKKLTVERAGIFVIVEAPGMGFQVKWDRGTRVYIKLLTRWKGRVQGLCGNYNGDALDDLTTPTSGVESNPYIFGDSWKLQDFCPKPTAQIDTCLEHPNRKTWAQRSCGILKSDIFRSCHVEVPIDPYMKRCTYDTCACDQGGDCECLCTALAAYAHACAVKGVIIKWRTPDLCPMQCDPHCSHYSPCMSACPIETCDNILEQAKGQRMCIEDSCIEGCQIKPCDGEKIYLNESYTECVPKSVCKPICLEKDGIIYYEGDVMQSDDCHICQCTRGKEVCSGTPCTTPVSVTESRTETTSNTPISDGKVICKSGWTNWLNEDKLDSKPTKTKPKPMKNNDVEPLPSYFVLMNLANSSGVCEKSFIKKIECHVTGSQKNFKDTGDNVECSIERGLICLGQCHDYEIRVYCNCHNTIEIEPLTTIRTTIVEESTTPIKLANIIAEVQTTEPTKAVVSSVCDPTIPHIEFPGDCYKFLHCQPDIDGSWIYVEKTCGPTMMFNPTAMICDWIQSVQAIKPECVEIPKELERYIITTTTAQPIKPTTSKCPPGQEWNKCAIPCGRACNFFSKRLQMNGLCKHESKDCIAGCTEINSMATCPPGRYWRDNRACAAKAECTCATKMGHMVKPGQTYNESVCEVCQCIDDVYVCDTSHCEEKLVTVNFEEAELLKPQKHYSTEGPKMEEVKHNEIIIAETTTPPLKCMEKLVPMIESNDRPLPDSAFNASSYLGSSFKPQYARLHSKPTELSSGSWSPEINDQMQYLQVGFIKPVPLFGVIIRGSPIFDQYVTSFKILHSHDGIAFHYLVDETKRPQIFRGPIDSRTPVKSMFKIPIEAKTVRIYPLSWHGSIAIRVELLGCPREEDIIETTVPIIATKPPTIKPTKPITKRPVIIETTTHIEDNEEPMCDEPMGLENGELGPGQIETSSDKYSPKGKPVKPFNLLKLSSMNGWRPNIDSPNEYVQFNFLEPRNLTGLKTKGGPNGWVTGYNVLYSPDKLIWNKVLSPEGKPKVFLGNFDADTIKVNNFKYPIHAQYLKIVPIKWHDTIELKIEPLGCFKPYPYRREEPVEVVTLPILMTTQPDCGTCPGVLNAPLPIEGMCRCYPPMFWNGNECVLRTQCPCMVGHIPYNVGTKYESDDCSQCVCVLGGVAQCKPQECPPCQKGLRPIKSATCVCLCEPCLDDQVLCPSSGACIPELSWCDGIQDCTDDELNCAHQKKEKPKIESSVEEKITIIKTCPEAKCPPGFQIKSKPSNSSDQKLSPMFQDAPQEKVYLKTEVITKTSTKSGIKSKLPRPNVLPIEKQEECMDFLCVPEKPTFNRKKPEKLICPEPECPKGYNVVGGIEISPMNGCTKYTCELVPQKDAVCNVTGRTFNTFDGTEFKYDICEHVLARDLKTDDWSIILLKNCSAGNYICTKELIINDKKSDFVATLFPDFTIELNGYRYTIAQLQKSTVAKMNTFVVSKVGNTIVFVSHLHSFWVTFDQLGDVRVGISSKKHDSSVDGLCGFYNGKSIDDKRLPNGKIAPSTVDFGNAWFVNPENRKQCEPHACPKELQDEAWSMCNAIKHETFKPCTRAVDIDRFISKCLETTCECLKSNKETNQSKQCKCLILQNYVTDCLAADESINLDTWRTINQCEAKCPSGLVHKDCYRRRCEPSCDTMKTEQCQHLPGTCFSGCYCPEGMVRNGEQCIPIGDCKDCQCESFGKSQYLTYDRKNFTLDGNCTYLLSRDILLPNVHTFQLYVTVGPCEQLKTQTAVKGVKNTSNKQKRLTTCAQSLHLLYGSHIIHLQKSKKNNIIAIVDGIEVKKLPLNKPWLEVSKTAKEISVKLPESNVNLIASFEDVSFSVKLPSIKYGKQLEGLCGDCNGNPNNDLQMNPKSKRKSDKLNDIVESWLADEPALGPKEEQCLTEEETETDCIPLPPEDDPCFELLDEDLFGSCHLIVDAVPYLSACQQDMCKTGPNQKGACSHLAAYARECSRNGICLDWRKNKCNESRECLPGMSYEPCGCDVTCDMIKENKRKCSPYNQTSDCFCPDGKVKHNDKCIPESQCIVCDDQGHVLGDKWYPDKCSECVCDKNGKVTCTKKECTSKGVVCQTGFKQMILEEEGLCCPIYKCVPEPTPLPFLCPDMPLPKCASDQQNKMETGPDGCSKYICECKPLDQCPKLEKPKLMPGERVVVEKTGCCPYNSIICDKTLCEKKPTDCKELFYNVIRIEPAKNQSNQCCEEYKCIPPKDKCIVELSGKKVLKKPNEKWNTPDPCIQKQCTYGPDGILIETKIIENCKNEKCELGFELEVPKGKCCGKCIQRKCVFDGKIFMPDQIWTSQDNCTTYTCIKKDNHFGVTSISETCPDVTNCPESLRIVKGCCQYCKPDIENQKNCDASLLSDSETIGLVFQRTSKHGICRNPKPVRGFTECHGSCSSGTKYNELSLKQDRKCDCCTAIDYQNLSVELKCDDNFEYSITISVPKSCSCEPCSENLIDARFGS